MRVKGNGDESTEHFAIVALDPAVFETMVAVVL